MSIRSAIGRHVRAERLFVFNPEMPCDLNERSFIYDEEIKNLLEGPWQSNSCASRVGSLLADIESFVRGQEVVISLVPFEADTALFGRLSRSSERLWDFRSRRPSPGIRIFGCWADIDTFVALEWYPRSRPWNGKEPLRGRENPLWEIAKRRSSEKWNKLFPHFDKKGGEDVYDYISEKVTSANSI